MRKIFLIVLGIVFVFAATSYSAGPVPCANCSINGGGHLLEDTEGKRKDWYDISFGGWVLEDDGVLNGEFQINFHNVGDDDFDKSSFHTTNITDANFYIGQDCSAMNFTATGEFNGISDYTVIFRAGDSGSPNTGDTTRVELRDPYGTLVYDTHFRGEFTDESDCVGTARTGLDKGNITIKIIP
jgi:hypothetical protein